MGEAIHRLDFERENPGDIAAWELAGKPANWHVSQARQKNKHCINIGLVTG
jgi:hypothetical protein